MVEATFPDNLIYYLKLNNEFLISHMTDNELYQFVIKSIPEARAYNLFGTRDILNFICLKLIYKENFLTDKGLNQKLNGQKLELSIEQMPNAFAFDDKAHLIWIIYAFAWDKISVQPDLKDLVASYKVLQNGSSIKSGSITIKNNEQNKGLRFFQSWKSAISEYLVQYDQDMANMTKTFIDKLNQEL